MDASAKTRAALPWRMIGAVVSVRDLGLRDHLCWAYDDPIVHRARLAEFLTDGAVGRLRLLHIAPGLADELRAELAMLVGRDELMGRDALRVMSLEQVHRRGEPVDLLRLAAMVEDAVAEAVADGYAGLRISAELTTAARIPEQRGTLARFEMRLEQYISRHPLSALCSYDGELGAPVIAEVACLHPAAAPSLTPFQIFARDDGAIGLGGEIDLSCLDEFRRALCRIQPPPGAVVVVNMAAVDFIDHRALLTLDSWAAHNRAWVIVRAAPSIVHRLARLVPLRHLQLRPCTRAL